MAECIERETAIAIIEEKQKELCPVGMYSRHAVYGSDREKFDAWEEIIEALEAIPAADVQPVRHGRWVETTQPMGWDDVTCAECSECGEDFVLDEWGMEDMKNLMHYCPNCGCAMEDV